MMKLKEMLEKAEKNYMDAVQEGNLAVKEIFAKRIMEINKAMKKAEREESKKYAYEMKQKEMMKEFN